MSRSVDHLPWRDALKHGVNVCYCQMCIASRSPRENNIKRHKKRERIARDESREVIP